MTGREKPKRKALHRGLDDIVNRDASLTSKLLGRVKPLVREPLEVSQAAEESPAAESHDEGIAPRAIVPRAVPASVKQRPKAHAERSSVRRLDDARTEAATLASAIDTEGAKKPATRDALTFDEFASRWEFILRSGERFGKLRVCQVLYENTYAAGQETFFTSYEKLARLAGLEKKQCAINIRQLESLGFVERVNIYNTATRQGTEFRLHLEPLPPQARKTPRHHHSDGDLSK